MNKKPFVLQAKHGFLCAFILIFLAFATNKILWFAYDHSSLFQEWNKSNSNLLQGLLMVFRSIYWILTAVFLSKYMSDGEFMPKLGLNRQPTVMGWFVSFAAIGIGMIAVYGINKSFIPPNHFTQSFFLEGGFAKWFLIGYAVLIAPVSEEIVMRGFLYTAFRGRFNMPKSIALVLMVHAYFHWGLIIHSFYTYSCLILLEVMLCAIREWTGNVWNCVLSHAAYNGTQNMPLIVCGALLFVILPCILYLERKKLRHV